MTTTYQPAIDAGAGLQRGITTHLNPDGTVTVHAPGHHRLSELKDAAALRFADELQTAVDWPALLYTAERLDGTFAATYALDGYELTA